MGFSGSLQWWEEWQLRILVLGSMFVQWLLFCSVGLRIYACRWLRAVVWIAYIAGDALPIYALATLFNRHNCGELTSDGRGSSSLEIIWAPFLLIHLGGQHTISAYSLEDNELWRRHVITVVCQITVALYVFCKWWSGDERQLMAAVLLFIVGIIKFGRKPWVLWSASFKCMLASADVYLPKPGLGCWRLCGNHFGRRSAQEVREEEIDLSLQEYVEEAKKYIEEEKEEEKEEEEKEEEIHHVYCMFVDVPAPYSTRLIDLRSFLGVRDKEAHRFFKRLLHIVFWMLYTSWSSLSFLSVSINILLPGVVLASMVLFATSHKDGYNKTDVTVTYILFGTNFALELVPWLLWFDLAYRKLVGGHKIRTSRSVSTVSWDMVSQYNLMSFSISKKNPTILMKLAAFSEYINKNYCIEQVAKAHEITELVTRHVKDGWKSGIHDAAGYKRFNNLRGQRTLRKHHQYQLEWMLKVPFDQSVLLWHIATDLCFHDHAGGQQRAAGSRLISNYMAYLLFNRPEMLMPGTRAGLFNVASYELECMMKEIEAPLDNEEMLLRVIMDITKEVEPPAMAKEEARWKVIQGVWLEMLCYSASRCRGYLHAKSLGEGGEYLTTVWLLWSFMGMETLPYTIQSRELPEEEEEEEEDFDFPIPRPSRSIC